MMSKLTRHVLALVAVVPIVLAAIIFGPQIRAGEDAGTYQLAPNWAQIPGGAWGVMTAVGTDAKGNVYAFQRSDPAIVMIFDRQGKFLRSWGTSEFEFPHGLTVGPDGSVWIADKKREQVLKFNAEGKLLMTIGQKDVTGNATSEYAFNGLSDVAVGKNGEIFVSDGENSAPGKPPYNNRVVKFGKNGKFIKYWGITGNGQSEFKAPHNIAVDSKGHVWVADRGNARLQEFDADGNFLSQITSFGTPVSIYISKDDTIFIGDTNKVVVGKTDGTVIGTVENVNDPHGIAVDETTGSIYVSQVGPKAILKFVKK